MQITLNSIPVKNKNIEPAEIDDDIVMMNLETGKYYYLTETGKDIWQLIDNKKSVGALITLLQSMYDVNYESCQKDLLDFLDQLCKSGIIYFQEGHN